MSDPHEARVRGGESPRADAAPGGQTLERIEPWRLDEGDDAQAEVLRTHYERYRFAARHVAGKRVLDVACGVGYGSRLLADEGRAARVLGVDIDPSAVAVARERYASEATRFACCPYDEAPLEGRVNVVVSMETIEHLPAPEEFLAFVRRAIHADGRFIGSVPITPGVDVNPYHLHDFTRRSIRRMLARAGFRVLEEQEQVQRVPWRLALGGLLSRKTRLGERPYRQGLLKFYLRHPVKLLRRVACTARHGLNIHYLLFVAAPAAESGSPPAPRPATRGAAP